MSVSVSPSGTLPEMDTNQLLILTFELDPYVRLGHAVSIQDLAKGQALVLNLGGALKDDETPFMTSLRVIMIIRITMMIIRTLMKGTKIMVKGFLCSCEQELISYKIMTVLWAMITLITLTILGRQTGSW